MIHIKYQLKESDLHGIGLFADADIQAGQLVYTASPLLDVNISEEQFEYLDEKEKQEVKWWGFWDEPNKVWHVDFDVTRFINHSTDSNLTQDKEKTDAYLIASRNISKGEELTQNYLEFESENDLRKRGINI
jgi:SET domain-containing protein